MRSFWDYFFTHSLQCVDGKPYVTPKQRMARYLLTNLLAILLTTYWHINRLVVIHFVSLWSLKSVPNMLPLLPYGVFMSTFITVVIIKQIMRSQLVLPELITSIIIMSIIHSYETKLISGNQWLVEPSKSITFTLCCRQQSSAIFDESMLMTGSGGSLAGRDTWLLSLCWRSISTSYLYHFWCWHWGLS